MRAHAALLFCAALLLPAAASAACPDWLTTDMTERGVPQREIARMCGPPLVRSLAPSLSAPAPAAAPAPAQRAAGPSNRCVPEQGVACETRSPRVVGSPCWCFGAGGEPVSGTIR